MAQVPYSPVPTVEPTEAGTPRVSLQTPGAAFGTNIAQAVETLGGNVQRASNEVLNTVFKIKEMEANAEANQAASKTFTQSGFLDNSFRLLQGRDPQDKLESHYNQLDGVYQANRATLSSPYAQKLYDSMTLRRNAYDKINAGSHAATQFKSYTDRSYEDNQIAILNRAVMDSNNVQGLHDAIQSTIDSEAKLNAGLPSYTADLRVQAKVGRLIKGVAGTLANTDPERAQNLLETLKNQFKEKLSNIDYLEAKDTIRRKAVDYYSAQDARHATGPGTLPEDHPVTKSADLINRIAEQKGWNTPESTFTPENLYKLIKQEGGSNNPRPNEYGYAGYFQMKPSEFGLPQDAFQNMSFEQQLDLFVNKYLPKYGYTGKEDLGVMNAAPGFRNASDDTVAYKAESKEAAANPAWVRYSGAGGAVTVGGIKAWLQAGGKGMGAPTVTNIPQIMESGSDLVDTHPIIAGDPASRELYLEKFQAAVQRNAHIQRAQLLQARRDALNDVDDTLFKVGSTGIGPRNEAEAMAIDPNFKAKVDAMSNPTSASYDPKLSQHVQKTFDYWISEAHKYGTPGWEDRVAAWKGLAAGLHSGDTEQAINISPESLGAPFEQTSKIRAIQLSLQKKAQDSHQLREVMGVIGSQLAGAKIYKDDRSTVRTQQFNQIVGQVAAKLEAWNALNPGKPVPDEEALKWGSDLIRPVVRARTVFGHEVPLLTTTVPAGVIKPDEQEEIKKNLRLRYPGIEPTDVEIGTVYGRKQRGPNAPY